MDTVQKALDSVIEKKSPTPVAKTARETFDPFDQAVKGLQEFSAAHPDVKHFSVCGIYASS